MRVLPDIVHVDSLATEELIDLTQRTLTAGTAHFVLAGRYFRVLKDRLRGDFIATMEMKFEDWSIDKIEAFMAIEEAFPDPATWARLPSHWTTQLRLTRIPKELREQWIRDEDETINPHLSRRAAEDLVVKARLLTDGGGDQDQADGGGDQDGDQDGDRGGGDDHGDAEQDSDDHPEPQPANQVDVARRNVDTSSDAELERMKAHIEEVQAYVERLEAENEQLKAENEQLKAEKLAAAGLSDIPIWHQRRQLTYAIQTAEEADGSKNDLERERLQKDAGRYILEIVRSATRDGLDIELIDLVYRAKPEQLTKDKETSFAASAAEAQPEQVGV
jgi:hypothetical protein